MYAPTQARICYLLTYLLWKTIKYYRMCLEQPSFSRTVNECSRWLDAGIVFKNYWYLKEMKILINSRHLRQENRRKICLYVLSFPTQNITFCWRKYCFDVKWIWEVLKVHQIKKKPMMLFDKFKETGF